MHQQEEKAKDTAIWKVFRKMLFFTVMMTVAPIASFFISKAYIFDGLLRMSEQSTYMYSAGVAVLVVHLILFAFIFVAFRDDKSGKKTAVDILKESAGKKD